MCRGVQFNDGRRADTVGELRAIVGEAFVVFSPLPFSQHIQPEECLCWVDMEATARRAGATVDRDGDPFDCVWTWAEGSKAH